MKISLQIIMLYTIISFISAEECAKVRFYCDEDISCCGPYSYCIGSECECDDQQDSENQICFKYVEVGSPCDDYHRCNSANNLKCADVNGENKCVALVTNAGSDCNELNVCDTESGLKCADVNGENKCVALVKMLEVLVMN